MTNIYHEFKFTSLLLFLCFIIEWMYHTFVSCMSTILDFMSIRAMDIQAIKKWNQWNYRMLWKQDKNLMTHNALWKQHWNCIDFVDCIRWNDTNGQCVSRGILWCYLQHKLSDKPLFSMIVKDNNRETHVGNISVLPSEKKWVFNEMFKHVFVELYGEHTICRNFWC